MCIVAAVNARFRLLGYSGESVSGHFDSVETRWCRGRTFKITRRGVDIADRSERAALVSLAGIDVFARAEVRLRRLSDHYINITNSTILPDKMQEINSRPASTGLHRTGHGAGPNTPLS